MSSMRVNPDDDCRKCMELLYGIFIEMKVFDFYWRYGLRRIVRIRPLYNPAPGYQIVISPPVRVKSVDPVKKAPSPFGGVIRYQILLPTLMSEPLKPRILTSFPMENVLYFRIIFGSVGSELISGTILPERR